MTQRRAALLALGCSLLTSAGASSAASARAQAASPLRMVATEFPPYTGSALPGAGLATSIVRNALAREGLEMSLSIRPWARALGEAQSGVFDGLIGVWRNPDRERLLLFSPALGITNRIGFMVRAGSPIEVSDLSQLRGRRIGVVHGYANPPAIEQAGLDLDPAIDDLHNLRKLLVGRIDLALIDKGVAHYLLQTQLPEGVKELVWREPAVSETPLHMALSRNMPQADAKMAAFSAGLDRMQKDGELAQLLRPFSGWL